MWHFLDLEYLHGICELIRKVKPEVILHTAGYTDVNECEVNMELAYRLDYTATRALARAAFETGSFFI